MRIATWNVNSVKQRVPRLLPWLDERQPDVVCLQETKLADDAFAELLGDELREPRLRGRRARRGGLERRGDPVAGRARGRGRRASPARPGSRTPRRARWRPPATACASTRSTSPTAARPDSDHYEYKLAWLAALRDVVAAGPDAAVVCGDMNIAPTDADVFDPAAYVGQTHVTPPEREALAELQALGLHDVVRDRWPTERVFTYWDYRAGMFHKDLGMRIDLVLAGDPVAERVKAAWIDRQARKGSGPERPRAGDRRPRRGARRRHRPGRPPPSAPVTKRGARSSLSRATRC